MQSKSLRTCPSKPLGLYAALEWGLRDITFLSPFSFRATKGSVNLTFHCIMTDHDNNLNIFIPKFTEEFLCLYIPNKKGDNTVVLTREDCKDVMGSKVSMQWIADKLKKKWEMTLSQTSTT